MAFSQQALQAQQLLIEQTRGIAGVAGIGLATEMGGQEVITVQITENRAGAFIPGKIGGFRVILRHMPI